MSVKRTLCIVLSVLLLINFSLTLCVSAAREPEITPLWNCTSSVYFNLSIVNKTAYIGVDIIGGSQVNNITATVQLYRKNILGLWVTVGSPFTYNVNASRLRASESVPNLSSGSYKAVLTASVYSPTNSDTNISFESYDSF